MSAKNEIDKLIAEYQKKIKGWKVDLLTDDSIGTKVFQDREYMVEMFTKDLENLKKSLVNQNVEINNQHEINLPMVVEANDYHEFQTVKDNFNMLLKKESLREKCLVNFEEIGFDDASGTYKAVFFDATKKLTIKDKLHIVVKNEISSCKNEDDLKRHLLLDLDFVLEEVLSNLNEEGISFKKAKKLKR